MHASGMPSLFDTFQSLAGRMRPPDWVVDEVQNRLVLLLNHILLQEPQAQQRLRRLSGQPVRVQWGGFHLTLAATAAGLMERPQAGAEPELTVTLTQASPFDLVQRVLAGDKPGVDIQGNVQLAAEVAWLVDNVRWDIEEDLSRWLGDAAAHTLVRAARTLGGAVKAFAARMTPVGGSAA
jgi:ubiquinone biosynthesis accessory factor UbiJ